MNKFTKQELNEIMENIKISEITVGAQRSHLVGKLQSMIDNYHYCNFDMQDWCSQCNGWRGMDGCYEK